MSVCEDKKFMASKIQFYTADNFFRKNEFGEITYKKSREIVLELAAAAHFYPGQNIMVDLRETTLADDLCDKILDVVMECSNNRPFSFYGKIAAVVPNDEVRLNRSKQFEIGMRIQNFKYRYFTNYDHAVEWLCDDQQLQRAGK